MGDQGKGYGLGDKKRHSGKWIMNLKNRERSIAKRFDELLKDGVSRKAAIALSLGEAGVSTRLSRDNYFGEESDRIEDKNKGGNMKSKTPRNWPRFK